MPKFDGARESREEMLINLIIIYIICIIIIIHIIYIIIAILRALLKSPKNTLVHIHSYTLSAVFLVWLFANEMKISYFCNVKR